MVKRFGLFIKILLILIIFSILLPQIIDKLINILIIEDRNNRPKGNSTFVLSPYTEENNFQENFFYLIMWYIK
ncbi:hypothetical protein FQB35_07345 [Crassaminicella thermophila]|uniref:Uncharacterized protein n=1 Tax=Crassaminicella thermophila TaxID=2599308 RepID=A0A5C0SE57_CRATE|nr:hypothetical protein [Crassaminicella thermophila]QEK12202.1 hypothetical protein FQB35_07345 [Crassaminicella thermophila]